MSQPKKPWWSPTPTRGQSLGLSVLLLVMAVVQVVTTLALEAPTWWQWALALLMLGFSTYYFLAWRVRGAREAQAAPE